MSKDINMFTAEKLATKIFSALQVAQKRGEILGRLESIGNECIWTIDCDCVWQTECGHMWTCPDGTPTDNKMKFCPMCGNELVEKQDVIDEHGNRKAGDK